MENHQNDKKRFDLSTAISVAEVAQKLSLKPVIVSGKSEWHGKNPSGAGAQKDGFILFDSGNAWDRKIEKHYSSVEVAHFAGILPTDFEPFRRYCEANPRPHNHTPKSNYTPNSRSESAPTPSDNAGNSSGVNGAKNSPGVGFSWSSAQLFNYVDESGNLLFQIGRIDFEDGKDFRQRRPDGRGGWIYKLGEVRRVVFGLPDVTRAETVLYVEGEKTAISVNDRLKTAGVFGEFVATTHSGGAKGLRESHAPPLYGKNVVVLPDNDEPGQAMAERLCQMLAGKVPSLKCVELPNLPVKGDAVDYLAAGGSIQGILSAAAGTLEWSLGAAKTPPKPPKTAAAAPPEPGTNRPESANATAPSSASNEPPKSPKKRFPLTTLAEVLNRPDPKFLIYRLLVDGGTSLFTAKHASFKSFVCLDMTLSVSAGRPWHGYDVKRGTVIYVAAEGAAGLKKRALAWFHHHDLPVPDNFFVLDMPLKIADARVLRDFIEQVGELNPAFIILDTLGRCAVGLNENDPSAMGIFIDAAGQLAATTKAHVMVVHHNNKSGEYRGASSLPAGVDTHLSAERSGDTLTLKTEKQKDDDELEPLVFEKIVVPIPGSGGLKHSLVFRRIETTPGGHFSISEAERKVLMALADNFGASGAASSHWKEAAAEKGISGTHYYRCQTRLLKMGAVKVVRGEQGKPGAIYVGNGNWPNPAEGAETGPEDEAANATNAADPVDANAPIQAEIPLEDAADETANRGAGATENAPENEVQNDETESEFDGESAAQKAPANVDAEDAFDVETDPETIAPADAKTDCAAMDSTTQIEPKNAEVADGHLDQILAQNGEEIPVPGTTESASKPDAEPGAETVESIESDGDSHHEAEAVLKGETSDFSPANDSDEGEVF